MADDVKTDGSSGETKATPLPKLKPIVEAKPGVPKKLTPLDGIKSTAADAKPTIKPTAKPIAPTAPAKPAAKPAATPMSKPMAATPQVKTSGDKPASPQSTKLKAAAAAAKQASIAAKSKAAGTDKLGSKSTKPAAGKATAPPSSVKKEASKRSKLAELKTEPDEELYDAPKCTAAIIMLIITLLASLSAVGMLAISIMEDSVASGMHEIVGSLAQKVDAVSIGPEAALKVTTDAQAILDEASKSLEKAKNVIMITRDGAATTEVERGLSAETALEAEEEFGADIVDEFDQTDEDELVTSPTEDPETSALEAEAMSEEFGGDDISIDTESELEVDDLEEDIGTELGLDELTEEDPALEEEFEDALEDL